MFANPYFEKAVHFTSRIPEKVHPDTLVIVIIPCLTEPDILLTLQSLYDCHPVPGRAEVIVLVNESENAPYEVSCYNLATMDAIRDWISRHPSEWLTFHPVGPVKLPARWAGVGLARKTAMDEALYRFNQLEQPDGIIVSLDADTLVDRNYFRSVLNHFKEHPRDVGVTIPFQHLTEGLPEKQQKGIRTYEQYLWYYKNALDWAGYPHAMYTIGSAFAVTSEAYMKRGGMTRRKAGEDFYFLQTLTQTGHVGEVKSTMVYPSARVSLRVPFGTGPFMKKWMANPDEALMTFNFQAFRDLKFIFDRRQLFYRAEQSRRTEGGELWPVSVQSYLTEEKVMPELEELARNCSHVEIFNNRFFQVFNAFRILKFLNFSHLRFYEKTSIDICMEELERENSPGRDDLFFNHKE
jgi:hypothetical protein